MYVKSIRFENLRGFKDLEFDFERPDGSFAGWSVFVGGNSSGKSTLLKGIALALMGPEFGRQLMVQTQGWIRRGEKRATATATLTWDKSIDPWRGGGKLPSTTFEAGVRWLAEKSSDVPVFRPVVKTRPQTRTRIQSAERGPWQPNTPGWFSAGFGPMRRLTGSSSESIRYSVGGGVMSRFVTLFREDAALSESEEWLRKTHSRTLETARPELKEFLDGVRQLLSDDLLPHGMRITEITVDHVKVQDRHGVELPMRDISDGCRSMYATVLDLVHGMFDVYGVDGLFATDEQGRVIVNRPGVVIIDEIEAHLHPAWQRQIPEWLKSHFPRIQFLVTTHSPLVAQAADANGIFVLPLQDDLNREPRRLAADEYEKIRWGRAEKTLLGAAFGLTSTRAIWANKQIRLWQKLNAKQNAGATLDSSEQTELKRLTQQMELTFEPVQQQESA